MNEYVAYFRTAMTGNHDEGPRPYPYQLRLALGTDFPFLLRAPTAAGKTAAVVLAWLYRRRTRPAETPRRLVYCLPMRVLVEQTVREIRKWFRNLGCEIPVHVLMGGVEAEQWYLEPEKQAVIVGTQDMLLSRALNRGYAASRFHWPIDFGLLNNDALWVFDEPQLMGNGVRTSAQLEAFRSLYGTYGPCRTLWMSATLEPSWLATVDARGRFDGKPLELGEGEYGNDYEPGSPLFTRMAAEKKLERWRGPSSIDTKKFARELIEVHQKGTQTLVMVNTVKRAVALAKELEKELDRKKSPGVKVLLVHSRFRPCDRKEIVDRLQDEEEASDRIVVSTQVVEAGVDISAKTLVTELAPWPSLVQRMGRCNRKGGDEVGRVFWVDLEGKHSAPYEEADLDVSRPLLRKLEGEKVSPRALADFQKAERIEMELPPGHVVRRRDIMDLFDTTPDLTGNDIDIQRFVRGSDPETDVHVFWRDDPDAENLLRPTREELCPVPVGVFIKEFAEKRRDDGVVPRIWDHIEGKWRMVRGDLREIRPGLTVLLASKDGGYTSRHGWDSDSLEKVVTVPPETGNDEEKVGSDPQSSIKAALTIAQHTMDVVKELEFIVESIGGVENERSALMDAARYHDIGKAHEAFQKAVHEANGSLDERLLWAKSGTEKRLEYGERKHFRHELASALALIGMGAPSLAAYLAGSHHGRVRMSIRSMPDEDGEAGSLFALGLREGDRLPEIDLGYSLLPPLELDLGPMKLGHAKSWVAESSALLDMLGPFRLAYLEALLRAADARASRKEAQHE
ncbi:MAG: CRISPR-associated endonuclease Cas3'' [Bacteroidota bacterium]|nr:CRISPR-associated endonuclease Cas3'' [Bacteroidota bacterium]